MLLAFAGFVAVGLVRVKNVILHRIGIATELAEYQRLVRGLQGGPGGEVNVAAVHIGLRATEPAGGGVDDAVAVQLFQLSVQHGKTGAEISVRETGRADLMRRLSTSLCSVNKDFQPVLVKIQHDFNPKIYKFEKFISTNLKTLFL